MKILLLVFVVTTQDHPHEQLGRVVFPVSCNAAAQSRFEEAMAMLHSFWWEAGQTAFAAVASADSSCAMAYWGSALNSWGNPFAGGPGGASGRGERLQRGAVAAQRARALGAPTPREQGFIAAANALYAGSDSVPNSRRLQAYSDTLARVYRDFPSDPEVGIYYALSLIATAPKTDTLFVRQKQAAGILNPMYARFPNHPGLAHYIIHAYDSPQLSPLGLDAARAYAKIAPAAPHAQHMPSHIFIRRGLWEETIAANQRAFEAGVSYAQQQRTAVAPEQLHALDYMVYGYLQLGRDDDARRTIAQGLALETTLSSDALLANYNRIAMEARLPLERSDWKAASELPVRAPGLTIGAALAHFTRGLGFARLGNVAGARAAMAALDTIGTDMTRRGDNEWGRVVTIKRQIVLSWTALAGGDTTAALRDAKAAADREDVTEKQPITPGELLPARELYGDMLRVTGRAQEARVAYETTLRREPGRKRTLDALR